MPWEVRKVDILVDFEFWTPPLGSLTCRSEWIRREPRANKLCTIVLLYVDVKICSGYLSGLDSGRVVMRGWVIVQEGNCACLVACGRRVSKDLDRGFHPKLSQERAARVWIRCRTWLLELSLFSSRPVYFMSREHESSLRVARLHAA